MKISEKAKDYAEGKALKAITSAIEQAYADGYNAGYNDALESKTDEKPEDLDDGVEYVDLGLPSGTKWAKGYLRDKDENLVWLSYEDAAKLNIPTVKQYEELLKYCKHERTNVSGQQITGTNGNFVKYYYIIWYKGDIKESCSQCRFWLKDKYEEGSLDRKVSYIQNGSEISPVKEFMGYRFPVMLVLTPEQQK